MEHFNFIQYYYNNSDKYIKQFLEIANELCKQTKFDFDTCCYTIKELLSDNPRSYIIRFENKIDLELYKEMIFCFYNGYINKCIEILKIIILK